MLQMINTSREEASAQTRTVFGTSLDDHIADGHALLHAHGCNGLTSELHSLVCATCTSNVTKQSMDGWMDGCIDKRMKADTCLH